MNEYNEDPGNISSSSGASSTGARATRGRYYSTPSSSGSQRGKVKDIVDSLEKSTPVQSTGFVDERLDPDMQNTRPRSESPTKQPASKESFVMDHHHPITPSPTKSSRPLPHRPTVSDLFSSTNADSDISAEEKEDDPTIKNVAKRNVYGREPRLLPFPPTHGKRSQYPSLSVY